MNKFAVLLNEKNDEVKQKILKRYKGTHHLEINDTVFLLRGDKLTSDISKELGLSSDSDNSVSGVVIKLNSAHAGFNKPKVWEWLDLDT